MIFTLLSNMVWFVVGLGLLIFLHELGHFLVARRIGVKVEVFSLGFGPKLFGFTRGETLYQVSLIPLGGYVKMMGEEPESGAASEEAASEVKEDPRSFQARSRWERAKILLAGPGSNLVLAYVLVVAAFVTGVEEPAYLMRPPVVGGVQEGSPAEAAGLRPGDRVLSINGEAVTTWKALTEWTALHPGERAVVAWERAGHRNEAAVTLGATDRYGTGWLGVEPFSPFVVAETQPGHAAEAAGLRAGDRIVAVDGEDVLFFARVQERIAAKRPGETLSLSIEREGSRFDVEAVLGEHEERKGAGYLGVMLAPPETFLRRLAPGAAALHGFAWLGDSTALLGRTLKRLFTGGLSLRAMSGPVDIAKFSGAAARSSPGHFLLFLAFLSLNLGVLNLLPIPVLDGGHLFLLGIEGLRRQDLSMAVKERFMQVGFVFLLTLMGVIVALDIIKNVF